MKRLAATLALTLLPLAALAAPKAELWERWDRHGDGTAAIDHATWNAFVAKYVKPGADGINRIAYGHVGNADRQGLEAYVLRLQGLTVTRFSKAEQRAYWINLYNATTVKTVLEHYPVPSILDIGISPGLFARGPWGKKLLKIEGEEVSLDDIEHRILRPIWKDPRTHYSVNCASLGCPNLAPRAYTAARMEEMLEAGARAYVNQPRGAQVQNGKLTVSNIYVWFKDDFGGDAGVIEHLKHYAGSSLAQQLKGITRIWDDHYDWTLNDLK